MASSTTRAQWVDLLLLALLALLIAGAFLATELQTTGGELGAPLDDTWIHFQFARNLSRGDGFSYNAGEPTPGSTAPLWTVLLASAGLLGIDYMRLAIGLSFLSFLATVWLSNGFAQWVSGSRWAALLAGLAVVVSGRFVWAGLAGMETTAFAALSLGAIWLFSQRGLTVPGALLFGLASQLRPEGHALFALAAGLAVVAAARRRESDRIRSLWRLALAVGVYAVISAPYVLFSLATTGQPLPNTFYAKAGSGSLFSLRTLTETGVWHWQDNAAALLLVLPGLWPLWRRSRLTVLWLLGLPLFTAVIIDFTWHHGRYTMPLIPLQMVAAAVGAHWLAGRLEGQARRVTFGALFAVVLLIGAWRLPAWAWMLGTNVQEILDIDVALGEWLAANTPEDAVLAVDDIGAIAFLSERRIVDMNGLVSPHVWPAMQAPEGLRRNQVLTRILSQSGPEYMVAFPLWRWDIATNEAVAAAVHHVETPTHTIIFQQDAYVYEMTWPYVAEAEPEQRLDARFGGGIGLIGYDVAPGNPVPLTLYWRSVAPVAEAYDVFVHVVDAAGEIVAQVDRQPVGGLAATDAWVPGDVIRDPIEVPLPDDLPPGEYALRVGLFLRETGARLPVTGAEAADDALELTTLVLP